MLTTLDDIKTFLGIPLSDTEQDAIITMFKDSVEQSIINYCETDFDTHDAIELADATQADVIVPKHFPILSVQGVWFDVDLDGGGGYELEAGKDFYFDSVAITLRRQTPFRRGAIKLQYTHGYSSIPADVKMVVYQSVKAELQRYKRNSEDVTSRSKEGESESYGMGAWDRLSGLPRQMLAKLQPYRVVGFANIPMAQRNI